MRTQKIGVFVSHIFGEYQTALCQGIIDKASEYGFCVNIFVTTDGENLGDYGLGEKSILRIPSLEEYSGIIFASSTYLLAELETSIRLMLLNHSSCPIIEIGSEAGDFPVIVLDNHSPVMNLMEHLITVHQYQTICYLGCQVESEFSESRFVHYREALKKHNLPFYEDLSLCCDYSDESIAACLERFLSLNNKPQAIVCYNDRIALSAMMLLQQKGLRIPQDIAITGCDCLEMGRENTPSLTSVTFPIYDMGTTAVMEILNRIDHKPVQDSVTVKAKPFIGSSCGCPGAYIPHLLYEDKLVKRIDRLEDSLFQNINMSASLQGVTDIDEGMELLENFVRSVPGCNEFYLCLYGDWNHISRHIRNLTLAENEDLDTDTMLLKFAMRDGVRLPECTFSRHSTLPDYLYADSSRIYIYSPLYFGEKDFGYIAISYKENRLRYSFPFFPWLMNINTMLKNICDHRNMGLLLNRLEDIYSRDDLTGLYNRQGFKLVSEEFLQKAKAAQMPLFAAVFDLDGLKIINDSFGHQEGDFAIQVLGHALENSVTDGTVCARLGGDEFYILGSDCSEEDVMLLMSRVQKYLDNYNRLHTKKYNISASGGYCLPVPPDYSDIQELFNKADKKMYEEKKSKTKHILKAENA